MSDAMNGVRNPPEENVDLRIGRMLVHEMARLRKMESDPNKGPAARLALAMWHPMMKFIVLEKEKGTNPELIANAIGQFFGNATFQLAANTINKEQTCRISINSAMDRINRCFAKIRPSLIVPAQAPGLVVAQEMVNPKKMKVE